MPRLGTTAAAAGRIAVRTANNSRWVRAGYQGARTVLQSFGRVLHLLWLQITGVFFVLFALTFASRLPRAYRGYVAGTTPQSHLLLLAGVSVMFAWFGVSSFWRARRR